VPARAGRQQVEQRLRGSGGRTPGGDDRAEVTAQRRDDGDGADLCGDRAEARVLRKTVSNTIVPSGLHQYVTLAATS